MVVFPNAKINLGLNIVEKRKDGYHNLISCFYPVMWQDALEIIEAPKFKFSSSGISVPGKVEDNLSVKAYKLLSKDFALPSVAMHLHKAIPMGAGLGGGSADASFTLKALNEMFNLFLNNDILEMYASELGSDCPFFIENKPVIASGTGNIFSSVNINLKGKYLVIVFPQVHVSTADAFSQINPGPPEFDLREILENQPLHKWKDCLVNDFEKGIFQKYPVIVQIKRLLYESGAVYASMSGSGSAVYGIFEEKVNIDRSLAEKYLLWEGNL